MQAKIYSLADKKAIILTETKRPVTPYGGLGVWVSFLHRIGYWEALREAMPMVLTSPNRIAPEETVTAFLTGVLVGERRFAQTMVLRRDETVHRLLGIARFPTDDTMRNLFRRFGWKESTVFFWKLWSWLLERVESGQYTLDLDSTVCERYGRQEGAKKGYNPKKKGRPSHHPLLAVLAENQLVVHGWLRSGNCSAARGTVGFLQETLALLPERLRIRGLRADSGFCEGEILGFLEERELWYTVVARMTAGVQRSVSGIKQWREVEKGWCAGECEVQLSGWKRSRRLVVIREEIKEDEATRGKWLLAVPGYTFRVWVTNRQESPEEVWRDYRGHATVEQRIDELKYDLAADDFCLRWFYATEVAFRLILLLYNLLGEFQRATELVKMAGHYKAPATLRTRVFLCGAILGRSGHRIVLHLSSCWGGLKQRKPLLDKLLEYAIPMSPKLASGVG